MGLIHMLVGLSEGHGPKLRQLLLCQLSMTMEHMSSAAFIPGRLMQTQHTTMVLLRTKEHCDFLPYKCRVWGAEANITTASGDADFVLYEGTTSLTSVTIDKDVVGTMSASRCVTKKFPSPQIITINTEYFLSVKPTSANSVNLMEITTPSAAAMDEMELGQNCHFGSRTDAGAWTLDTSRRPMISLIIDQLDDGAGGSGGPVGANIRGGFSN